jgi:type III secretion system YscQ/HrcQ family protein
MGTAMAEPGRIVDLQEVRAAQYGTLDSVLPSVDAATRDALNAWLKQRCAPLFRLGTEDYELRWLDHAPERWHVILELNVGSHRGLLALDGFAALDPLLVGEPFTLMPDALRDLAVQRFAARILTHAPPALTNALELRAIHWDVQRLPDWRCALPFSLHRRGDGTQLLGCLIFESAAGLQWLHAVLPVDGHSADVRSSLPVPLRLSVGQSTVGVAALQALEAGDVVWIESANITRKGVAVDLISPSARCTWRCRAWRESLQITSAPQIKSSAQEKITGSLQSFTGDQVMDAKRWQLDVPVTFDLGELHLQTADLERLQPGNMIELPQDVATATVSLRIADRCIAEGTLITIGKRLGVRISTVMAQREAGAA